MTDINYLRSNFIPVQSEYNIPKTMPAFAIIKDKPNSFEIIELSTSKVASRIN